MSGLRFRWMPLKIYIEMITNLHNLQRSLRTHVDINTGVSWAIHVISNDLAIKTADIVMYDRQLSKIKA